MDWNDHLAAANRNIDSFRALNPAAARGYTALHQGTMAAGEVPEKVKEMLAIAIGISSQCTDCIGFHIKAGLRHGLTRAELAEVVGVAMVMGGGPAYMFGAMALEAYDQLAPQPDPAG